MGTQNFKVIRQNGQVYDMAEIGVKVVAFTVHAPEVRHEFEEVDGRDGVIDLGTNYGSRTIEAECRMIARDIYDYPLLRNEVFRIFDSREAFYIVNDGEPGKRWLVKCASPFSMSRQAYVIGEFSLPFVALSPYAESTTTTLDPLIFESEAWQFGHGIPLEDVRYEHTQRNFRIYNMGDIAVDPREFPLHISIYTEDATQTRLELINHTTGDYFRYDGSTLDGIPIELIGVRVVRQNQSLSKKTNLGLITLAPGWNDMEIRSQEFQRIKFDFRFYYL